MYSLKYVAEIEAKGREAFDNHFHKCPATMTYDQWREAFKVGFRCGREDAMKDWAEHMTGMAKS